MQIAKWIGIVLVMGSVLSATTALHSLKHSFWKHLLDEIERDSPKEVETIREHCGRNRYNQHRYDRGLNKRIVGGNESRAFEWPWLVSIQLHPPPASTASPASRQQLQYPTGSSKKRRDVAANEESFRWMFERLSTTDSATEREFLVKKILDMIGGDSTSGNVTEPSRTMQQQEEQLSGHICGGSLVSPSWILTAKHCFDSHLNPSLTKDPSRWTVRVGEHNLNKQEEYQVDHEVETIITFPSTEEGDYDNEAGVRDDIALLKLRRPARFNEFVRPACLPYPREKFKAGTVCSVAGWGVTKEGGEISPVLRHISVPIISHEECKETFYPLLMWSPSFQILPSTICAGNNGDVDACQYDSGGPLMCTSDLDDQYIVVGVISYGFKCASGYPGIYTRVNHFLDWIHDSTLNN